MVISARESSQAPDFLLVNPRRRAAQSPTLDFFFATEPRALCPAPFSFRPWTHQTSAPVVASSTTVNADPLRQNPPAPTILLEAPTRHSLARLSVAQNRAQKKVHAPSPQNRALSLSRTRSTSASAVAVGNRLVLDGLDKFRQVVDFVTDDTKPATCNLRVPCRFLVNLKDDVAPHTAAPMFPAQNSQSPVPSVKNERRDAKFSLSASINSKVITACGAQRLTNGR